MHIIVLGCGRIGTEIAVTLDERGHSVAVVDRDAKSFSRLPERFGGRSVVGSGFDREVLEKAGVGETQGLAAVMYGDNSNIVAARIARENYEIPHVVARIKDPRRAEIYQRLGIPTVATVTWTSDQVLRRLFPDDTTTNWTDVSGLLHLVERGLPDSWAGHRLDGLDGGDRFRLVAITRAGEARVSVPGLVGQEGDVLHFVVRQDAADQLESTLAQGGAHA